MNGYEVSESDQRSSAWLRVLLVAKLCKSDKVERMVQNTSNSKYDTEIFI